jgi:hypothetical protein
VLGVGVLTDQTDRVAIDPIAALTSSDEAFPLINAVNGIHTTIPHSIDYQIVWTLIFLAAQRPPARTARAVLTVEAPLLAPDDPLFQPFEYSWAEFFPQGSMWFEPRTDDAASLFAGLTAARNESVTVHLDKSTTPANLIHKGPKVVLPQELPTGTLMLHNADVSPELPAVIAWATKEPVLIITRGPAPKLAGSPSKLSVIETVPPRDSGSAEAPKDAGTALLTHIADTAHPLLTFADDEEQPANVVLTTSKRVALPD